MSKRSVRLSKDITKEHIEALEIDLDKLGSEGERLRVMYNLGYISLYDLIMTVRDSNFDNKIE